VFSGVIASVNRVLGCFFWVRWLFQIGGGFDFRCFLQGNHPNADVTLTYSNETVFNDLNRGAVAPAKAVLLGKLKVSRFVCPDFFGSVIIACPVPCSDQRQLETVDQVDE
jgi:hypothetical protein